MIIYKTTNLINGKIYIGKDTKNNPTYLGSGVLLKKAIDKYGKENFIKEIIEKCNEHDILNEREKYWINVFDSKNTLIGYNIAEGGHGGLTYTDETRKRISEMFKGRFVSEETKQKMSKSRKGKFKHTEKAKEKISKKHKGKKLTQEHRDKISEACKHTPKSKEFIENMGTINKYWPTGTKHTEETKKKMSEYHKANPVRYWLGKKRPDETIEKARESNKGFKHTEEHKQKISGEGNPFYGKSHTEEAKLRISESKKNKTPEQKLETYRKFYISRVGKEPSEEQLRLKLEEIKNNTNV
jgi:group I intron endonuclease